MTENEGAKKNDEESGGPRDVGGEAVVDNPWVDSQDDPKVQPQAEAQSEAQSGAQPDAGQDSEQFADASAALFGRIQELEHKLDEALRALAESQNIQRRSREELERTRKFGSQTLATELLPILDNFDRTLNAAEQGSSLESLLSGVKAIERQLSTALDRVGVKRIASIGQPFDPNIHEAIATDPDSDAPEDTISAEIEPGYCLHDRVLRPAKVRVVTKNGS